MKFLLSFVFLLTLLGAFGRIEISPGYSVYLYEPILGLIFLLKVKQVLRTRGNIILLGSLGVLVGYLLLRIGWSLGTKYDVKGLLYVLRFGFYLFGFLAFKEVFNQKEVYLFVKKYLKFFLFFFSFVNILQYIFFRDLQVLKYIGWDPHLGRLVGPFLDPFLAASLIGILFFLSIRLKYFVFSLLLLVLLLLTNSRAAILSLSLSSMAASHFRKMIFRFKIIILLFPFLVLLAFFLNPGIAGNPLRVDTVASRIEDYKKGIALVEENPVFGVGYNKLLEFREKTKKIFKYSTGVYNPQGGFHSSYLTLLAVGGLVGLIGYLQFCVRIIKLYPFPELFIFVGVFSLFDNVLLHPLLLLYLAASLALLRSFNNS